MYPQHDLSSSILQGSLLQCYPSTGRTAILIYSAANHLIRIGPMVLLQLVPAGLICDCRLLVQASHILRCRRGPSPALPSRSSLLTEHWQHPRSHSCWKLLQPQMTGQPPGLALSRILPL